MSFRSIKLINWCHLRDRLPLALRCKRYVRNFSELFAQKHGSKSNKIRSILNHSEVIYFNPCSESVLQLPPTSLVRVRPSSTSFFWPAKLLVWFCVKTMTASHILLGVLSRVLRSQKKAIKSGLMTASATNTGSRIGRMSVSRIVVLFGKLKRVANVPENRKRKRIVRWKHKGMVWGCDFNVIFSSAFLLSAVGYPYWHNSYLNTLPESNAFSLKSLMHSFLLNLSFIRVLINRSYFSIWGGGNQTNSEPLYMYRYRYPPCFRSPDNKGGIVAPPLLTPKTPYFFRLRRAFGQGKHCFWAFQDVYSVFFFPLFILNIFVKKYYRNLLSNNIYVMF